ncbi:MAG: hypothetical protein ACLFPP_09145 [Spirochaetaceae bacterium]
MLTSRGTSRKALPWSSRILGLLLLLVSSALPAQDDERRAILLQGPNLVRGVPALEANAFEAQRARYELSSGEEVELYLLSLIIGSIDAWEPFDCPALAGSGVTLNRREGSASRVFAYRSEEEGRTVLLLGAEESGEACAFLAAFLEELGYFSSALGESPLLPFPGVLTY